MCGKEGKGGNIKDHIEANHLEGIVLLCVLSLQDDFYISFCDGDTRGGVEKHIMIDVCC